MMVGMASGKIYPFPPGEAEDAIELHEPGRHRCTGRHRQRQSEREPGDDTGAMPIRQPVGEEQHQSGIEAGLGEGGGRSGCRSENCQQGTRMRPVPHLPLSSQPRHRVRYSLLKSSNTLGPFCPRPPFPDVVCTIATHHPLSLHYVAVLAARAALDYSVYGPVQKVVAPTGTAAAASRDQFAWQSWGVFRAIHCRLGARSHRRL